ncbi:unnamed protein product [Dibothriocephalus latus]|uniref:Uncharacterized protein n=1 Tax=Dibothriocephalus latus TaxID=60516 RepID=A0A3P7N4K2_DIBLA|nr:unnamed protein product [Dibothriocephalus latus]
MAYAVFWTILTATGLLVSTAFAESGKQATLAKTSVDSEFRKLAAPPTVSQFLRQTYIAVRELAFDWKKYPYDHDFTVRMFTDGLPNRYETCFVIVVTLSFILFRAIVDPPLRVSVHTNHVVYVFMYATEFVF